MLTTQIQVILLYFSGIYLSLQVYKQIIKDRVRIFNRTFFLFAHETEHFSANIEQRTNTGHCFLKVFPPNSCLGAFMTLTSPMKKSPDLCALEIFAQYSSRVGMLVGRFPKKLRNKWAKTVFTHLEMTIPHQKPWYTLHISFVEKTNIQCY